MGKFSVMWGHCVYSKPKLSLFAFDLVVPLPWSKVPQNLIAGSGLERGVVAERPGLTMLQGVPRRKGH